MDDGALAAWAAAHRERLSLPFLGWLSEEELAARGEERQQQLWELGSKLMALREGLSPVGNDVLQAELRAAAARRCSPGSSASSSDAEDAAAAAAAGAGSSERAQQGAAPPAQQQQQQQQQAQQQQQQQAPGAALATPAFVSTVQQTAALGLSPEGMVLFEQQAAALEATVGISRAKSLTEVIGRARVQDERQLQGMADADAAVSAGGEGRAGRAVCRRVGQRGCGPATPNMACT